MCNEAFLAFCHYDQISEKVTLKEDFFFWLTVLEAFQSLFSGSITCRAVVGEAVPNGKVVGTGRVLILW